MSRRSKNTPQDRARAQICVAAVSMEFGAEELDLARPSLRGVDIDFARQVAMYLAHVQFGMSHTRIGELFSRDRSTVSHAFRAVSDLLDDSVFAERLDRLGERLDAFRAVSFDVDGADA